MRILQLCKKFPYPLKDGEVIGIYMYTKAFSRLGHEVSVLAMNTRKHHFDTAKLPDEIRVMAKFYPVEVNASVKLQKAILNLFSSRCYSIERFYSKEYERKLEEILSVNEFDIVQLEGSYLSQYIDVIRKFSKAKIILRSQNVEYEIWERAATNEKNILMKWYLNLLSQRMKKYELSFLNRYDAIAPVTEKDAQHFRKMGCTIPIHVCEHGVETEALNPDYDQFEFPTVFHIGSMDWRPNLVGLTWFLQDVWPEVLDDIPSAKLYLAGRNFPDDWKQLEFPNVAMVGEVDDAVAFMKSKAVMIVPLFSGSGIRVKLMEAMALGKAIVTTAIGAEGINASDKKDFFIADDEKEFASAIVALLKSKEICTQAGKSARTFAESNFNYLRLVGDLASFYQKLPVH